MEEPKQKWAVAFIDGQNLNHHAKAAFGHPSPGNYDPKKLTDAVCAAGGWQSRGARFYTGTPITRMDSFWHAY